MNKNERRGIMVIIVALIIVIIVAINLILPKEEQKKGKNEEQKENTKVEEYAVELEDGTRVNTSNKLKEDKEFNGLRISNISIEEKENETTVQADVINQTMEGQGDYGIYLIIKDNQGNEIKKIAGYINYVEANEKTKLKIKTSYDFANAYDFDIEKQ